MNEKITFTFLEFVLYLAVSSCVSVVITRVGFTPPPCEKTHMSDYVDKAKDAAKDVAKDVAIETLKKVL